jgi:hypothetical protein
MQARKSSVSPAAMTCWLLAIAFAVVGLFLPGLVSLVLGSETQLDPYGSWAEIGWSVAYLAAVFVPWGCTLYFGVAGRRAQKNFNVRIMEERSSEAQREILGAVRAGMAPPPYFLYLRPFYADELLIENPRVSSIAFLPSHYYDPTVSWESVFADRIETFGRLVSLGTSTDSLSADRIESSDATWIRDFVLLASFADCIFIWPSTRPGTRWEIRWLEEHGLARKAVFLIANGYDEFTELCGDTWDRVRAFLMQLEFQPPIRRGVFFTATKASSLVRPLSLARRRSRQVLRELIASASTAAASDKWEFWRRADAAVVASPPEWGAEPLDVLLPCVECGQPLTDIVCLRCERDTESATATDLGLTLAEDAACPAFNAFGQLQWPLNLPANW